MIERIAQDQAGLLGSTADTLEHVGSARLVTADGEIQARLTRFRWGDDVLEVARRRDGLPCGRSMSVLARSPEARRTRVITFHLAASLAKLEPGPEDGGRPAA
jgi:hypothetical protein